MGSVRRMFELLEVGLLKLVIEELLEVGVGELESLDDTDDEPLGLDPEVLLGPGDAELDTLVPTEEETLLDTEDTEDTEAVEPDPLAATEEE